MIYLMKDREGDILQPDEGKTSASRFESVFHEHWARVYRLLCRLVGDPSEAEDLALETFVRLHERHSEPESGFNTGAWLWRVATNLGLHSIRSRKRREQYELKAGKAALDEPAEDQPAEIFAQREERGLARKTLSRMKPQQAQILILRYSGMAYKEIASAMGVPATSIGPLLARAEREFEKQYRALAKEEA
jgi:RNA polymerase sigma-70 factor (ECF subfamily)